MKNQFTNKVKMHAVKHKLEARSNIALLSRFGAAGEVLGWGNTTQFSRDCRIEMLRQFKRFRSADYRLKFKKAVSSAIRYVAVKNGVDDNCLIRDAITLVLGPKALVKS